LRKRLTLTSKLAGPTTCDKSNISAMQWTG